MSKVLCEQAFHMSQTPQNNFPKTLLDVHSRVCHRRKQLRHGSAAAACARLNWILGGLQLTRGWVSGANGKILPELISHMAPCSFCNHLVLQGKLPDVAMLGQEQLPSLLSPGVPSLRHSQCKGYSTWKNHCGCNTCGFDVQIIADPA